MKEYWTKRYEEERTGWDIGYPSTPIKEYLDQLEDKSSKILFPGAGNGYEVEYAFRQGFKNIFILDISPLPLEAFKKRNPSFPTQQVILDNFFDHHGQYDLIIEQTFFCSFPPTKELRTQYARTMHTLIKPKGKLVGIYFKMPLTGDMNKRPFGGNQKEYESYLIPYFTILQFNDCYNSITPRAGNELFGIFERKPNQIEG